MRVLVIGGVTAIKERFLFGKNVHVKFVTCGRDGCACRLGQRHGPYYYRREKTGSGRYKDVYVKPHTIPLDFAYTVVGREDVILDINKLDDLSPIFENCAVFEVKGPLKVARGI
jgi:hypothetical protein